MMRSFIMHYRNCLQNSWRAVNLTTFHRQQSSDMRRASIFQSAALVAAILLMVLVLSVRSDDDLDDYRGHKLYRRSSQRTPTSLIELLIGIFDTFYVTAKREERKLRQRHAIYPQLRPKEATTRYY